jgi:hypothetical protein
VSRIIYPEKCKEFVSDDQNFIKVAAGCVRLLVHEPVRIDTRIIRLLIRLGSYNSIVGPDHNNLLRTGPF